MPSLPVSLSQQPLWKKEKRCAREGEGEGGGGGGASAAERSAFPDRTVKRLREMVVVVEGSLALRSTCPHPPTHRSFLPRIADCHKARALSLLSSPLLSYPSLFFSLSLSQVTEALPVFWVSLSLPVLFFFLSLCLCVSVLGAMR